MDTSSAHQTLVTGGAGKVGRRLTARLVRPAGSFIDYASPAAAAQAGSRSRP